VISHAEATDHIQEASGLDALSGLWNCALDTLLVTGAWPQVPRLKLFVMEDDDEKKYCRNELVLGDTTQPSSQMGPWYLFQVGHDRDRGRWEGPPEAVNTGCMHMDDCAVYCSCLCVCRQHLMSLAMLDTASCVL
jgi:hypothetical protein